MSYKKLASQGGAQNSARLTVQIEKESRSLEEPHPLAGKVFYLLKHDLSQVLKENRKEIWGSIIGRGGFTPIRVREETLIGILNSADNPRKYPAALICTAEQIPLLVAGVNFSYARAMDVLRVESVRFFIIDANGKAELDDLKPGTYYVCGLGKTAQKTGVWNVRTELKPGKNNLKLDSLNIIGRQK